MRRISALLLLLSGWAASCVEGGSSGAVWATPHDSYSSSVGVLGCKVDTNRVAYWPGSVDCDDVCVSLSYEGRTVKLLRVDRSQGAHDISYDAWNYLYTGYSATEKPAAGGPVAMNFASVDPEECADLLHTDGRKLPLSAANSMNFLASCLARPDSWVAKNYVLYNILDSTCSWGHDETCTLDWPAANQASCPSVLGDPAALTSAPVYNIRYPSGQTVVASSGQVVDPQNNSGGSGGGGGDSDSSSDRCIRVSPNLFILTLAAAASNWLVYAGVVHF
ncbi:uncharacterized protein F4812DRAFT_373760 [Daldinia caldariorum]|uniref:uncharacterized protein n=1 Tax=Daldinia caldariorum TaxID=326644 RepID=UPI0020085F0B|nr:uncharacterized protein F4812DRAFT_373760 [Daldinia caldariorum]KAI1468576.1 hypothetical protein F4812DRAFT_373760 [Daldinia caldariorum]